MKTEGAKKGTKRKSVDPSVAADSGTKRPRKTAKKATKGELSANGPFTHTDVEVVTGNAQEEPIKYPRGTDLEADLVVDPIPSDLTPDYQKLLADRMAMIAAALLLSPKNELREQIKPLAPANFMVSNQGLSQPTRLWPVVEGALIPSALHIAPTMNEIGHNPTPMSPEVAAQLVFRCYLQNRVNYADSTAQVSALSDLPGEPLPSDDPSKCTVCCRSWERVHEYGERRIYRVYTDNHFGDTVCGPCLRPVGLQNGRVIPLGSTFPAGMCGVCLRLWHQAFLMGTAEPPPPQEGPSSKIRLVPLTADHPWAICPPCRGYDPTNEASVIREYETLGLTIPTKPHIPDGIVRGTGDEWDNGIAYSILMTLRGHPIGLTLQDFAVCVRFACHVFNIFRRGSFMFAPTTFAAIYIA